MLPHLLAIPMDPWEVTRVGDEIANIDGDERPGKPESTEAPLFEDRRKAFLESKDKGITEARQERTAQDNRLAEEHLEWSCPSDHEFLAADARLLDLVGTPDLLAVLASLFRFLVHDDGGAGLGHEEVDGLNYGAEDELNPEVPGQRQEPCDGSGNHGSDRSTQDGAQDDVADRILLSVGLVEIRYHS